MQRNPSDPKPKRRSPGQGQMFFEKTNNRWRVRVIDRDGKRYGRVARTEAEARVKLEELKARISANEYVPPRPTKPAKAKSQPKARMSLNLRIAILIRDWLRCQLCGRSAQEGAELEVDHVHPESKGGPTTMANLQTLCFECNRGKRDKVLESVSVTTSVTDPPK